MSTRADTARGAAAGLRAFQPDAPGTPVLVGFDGFVDSIIHVVDKRYDPDRFDRMATIEAFGRRVLDAAGQSANIELVTRQQKLGGNGPIMANALMSLGLPVTYIGGLGRPDVHPVFADFAAAVEAHTLADPGFTDALEFADGKLMLGKHDALRDIHQDRIDECIGRKTFDAIVGRSRLVGMVNWTMLTRMETVWRRMIDEVLPRDDADHRRVVFVDLADPEKRLAADLRRGLGMLTEMAAHADVVLGLNLKESTQVLAALGLPVPEKPEPAIESTAAAIRGALALHACVVHPRAGAAAATADGTTAAFAGPYVAEPKLSTGAGDNFNAGFCLGLLAGLTLPQCLAAGTGTSGYYVRHASSPTLDALADFLDELPAPEGG